MGMDMARDIRASNLASAERRERSKYRKKADKRADRAEDRADSAEDRAESAEKRAKRKSKRDKKESDQRIKSLKRNMRDVKDEKKHKKKLRSSEITKANAEAKLAKARAENAKNPLISDFTEKSALLDHYKKTVSAANARHAAEMGPVLNQLKEMNEGNLFSDPTVAGASGIAQRPENAAELLDLMAVRDSMVNTHKDFLSGLEQAFMASSNQPHTGQVSIIPYTNEYGTTYNLKLEGASVADAEAFYKKLKSMGINVGGGGTGSGGMGGGAQPPAITNPSDPANLGL